MCGVFGFISKSGSGPNIERLKKIAVATESRGRHAFGLAWIDKRGGIHTFKREGSASDRLADLDQVKGALAVIGHCRYATHGHQSDNRNNHPHQAGTGWLVHNGQVTNHLDLAVQHSLNLRSECDSEVLGHIIARKSGTLLKRTKRTVDAAHGSLAIMAIWANPVRLVFARNGRPLSYGDMQHGAYFGSIYDSLPEVRSTIINGTIGMVTYSDGGFKFNFDKVDEENIVHRLEKFGEYTTSRGLVKKNAKDKDGAKYTVREVKLRGVKGDQRLYDPSVRVYPVYTPHYK